MEDQEDRTKRWVEDIPLLMELHDELTEYEESESPILNSMVRNTYFQHVKKLLVENGNQTHACLSDDDINRYAQKIEMNALKTCMSTMVYRYVMLQEINNIKCMTHSNVSFTEKKTLIPEEIVKPAESLNIYLNNFDENSRDTNLVSLVTNRDYSQNMLNTNELNIKQSTSSPGESHEHGNSKSEPMAVDNNEVTNPFIAGHCLKRPVLVIKNENITSANADSSSNAEDGQKEIEYKKIFQELEEMFAQDENNSSAGGQNVVANVQTSPTSVIYSDRYFAHGNRKFWYLEFEIHKAQYLQKTDSMYELNRLKYKKVEENIRMIFGEESPGCNSPLVLKKIIFICKDRITWHVKNSLSLYYKKKRFRSADEFRILVKNIVPRLIQINPYMEYQFIYKAISKVFNKKNTHVQNINHIQIIVTKVEKYVSEMIHNNL